VALAFSKYHSCSSFSMTVLQWYPLVVSSTQMVVVLAPDWRLETGDWRLETGDWRLETGDWRLETGDWRLETGDWRLEYKYPVPCTIIVRDGPCDHVSS
jgi:hypothetical protein